MLQLDWRLGDGAAASADKVLSGSSVLKVVRKQMLPVRHKPLAVANLQKADHWQTAGLVTAWGLDLGRPMLLCIGTVAFGTA